jgi:alpha-glucuronidase
MWQEFFNEIKGVELKGLAGVANIGDATNWCGSDFAQANWYAFGRMAWNPALGPTKIAKEWVLQTFTHDATAVNNIVDLMMESREAVVNYMMPLGLHHQFAWGHHYGPQPWCEIRGARPDWLPSYYHKADAQGLGFDRTSKGSNAVAQYPKDLAEQLDDINNCPEKYLLWFHHASWSHPMRSGKTLWNELCHKYQEGVTTVRDMQDRWNKAMDKVDPQRAEAVKKKLDIQLKDAIWWKDACLLYFQTFSKMPLPNDIEEPTHRLDEMKRVELGISNYECPSAELLDKMR